MEKSIVDIILPCYNPEKDWAINVVDSFERIKVEAKTWVPNMIIVNDGSSKGVTDEDVDYLRKNIEKFTWVSYDVNRGKGFALRKGVEMSQADFLIYTDIDFPYTHESMMKLVNALIQKKADVLAGERSEVYYKQTPFVRKVISKIFKKVVRWLLHIRVKDTQAGLKGMNAGAKSAFMATTIDRYLFDIEFLWLASKKHEVDSFPIILREHVVFSKMNSKILLTEGLNFVKFYIQTLK